MACAPCVCAQPLTWYCSGMKKKLTDAAGICTQRDGGMGARQLGHTCAPQICRDSLPNTTRPPLPNPPLPKPPRSSPRQPAGPRPTHLPTQNFHPFFIVGRKSARSLAGRAPSWPCARVAGRRAGGQAGVRINQSTTSEAHGEPTEASWDQACTCTTAPAPPRQHPPGTPGSGQRPW